MSSKITFTVTTEAAMRSLYQSFPVNPRTGIARIEVELDEVKPLGGRNSNRVSAGSIKDKPGLSQAILQAFAPGSIFRIEEAREALKKAAYSPHSTSKTLYKMVKDGELKRLPKGKHGKHEYLVPEALS